jgi:hypothetical protein
MFHKNEQSHIPALGIKNHEVKMKSNINCNVSLQTWAIARNDFPTAANSLTFNSFVSSARGNIAETSR